MREFPGGAVVGTPHFQSMRHRFDPWAGTKILHAMQLGQKNEKKKKIENTYTVGRSIKKSTSKVKGFINMKKKILTFL